jgi:hypothetical protein
LQNASYLRYCRYAVLARAKPKVSEQQTGYKRADRMQRYPMVKTQRPAEPASDAGNDHEGSPKHELLVALREFCADCDVTSYRALARLSETLKTRYARPATPPCDLRPLSPTAISEILSGKRKNMAAMEWVASFVLSCQLHAVMARSDRRDQGTTILPHWAAIHAAHLAPAGPATRYQLAPDQQAHVTSHGPYGQLLIRRAQRGHPCARYRIALLLATDPDLADQAAGMLIDVASTGHPLALDLLDARDPNAPAGQLCRRAAAQHAYALAQAARKRGSREEADVYYRTAGRGGLREAAVGLAEVMLAPIDPEVATWLGQLTSQAGAGRHQARQPRSLLPATLASLVSRAAAQARNEIAASAGAQAGASRCTGGRPSLVRRSARSFPLGEW